MALESGTYISDLNPSNPVGATDKVSTLDDHVRLIKSTLQNTFPHIDGAVTATEDELNHLDGVTGTTGTGKLVLDNAPTIANLTVTGSITLPARSVADAALSDNVPLKNASNAFTGERLTLQYTQPALRFFETDANANERLWELVVDNGQFVLSTIADDGQGAVGALGVKRSGTAVTEIALFANSIALNSNSITLGGVNVADYARKSQENTFLAATQTVSAANATWLATNGMVGVKIQARSPDHTGVVGTESNHPLHFITNNIPRGSVGADGSFHLPVVRVSTSTTLAAGQVHAITSNATLPNMTTGQWVGVINNSGSSITVTKHASDTMYWTASGASVTSVTIPPRGKATFFCADGTNVYASGNIIGAS